MAVIEAVRIVADDLTGAADAAGAFVRLGWDAVVGLRPGAGSEVGAGGAAVLALTTESRDWPARRAATAVEACCASLGPPRPGVLAVQKIDSMLRGNPGAEVAAALAGWGLDRAVVAPAFPAQGRTTVDGLQLADGRPVAAAADGPGALGRPASANLRQVFRGLPCVIGDAAEDGDLDRLVARESARPDLDRILWVGSAGLAGALARRFVPPAPRPGEGAVAPRAPAAVSGVLTVCGSRHPATRAQVQGLAARGALVVTAPAVLAPRGWDGAAGVRRALAAGRDVVLLTPREPLPDGRAAAEALGAAAAAALVGEGGVAPLVLTGGDTAFSVLEALGVLGLRLGGEVEPGVPVGVAVPGGRSLVTKSGGFGSPDLLVRAVSRLRARFPAG